MEKLNRYTIVISTSIGIVYINTIVQYVSKDRNNCLIFLKKKKTKEMFTEN